MNKYEMEKRLLKAKDEQEINRILDEIELEEAKEVIKLMISRVNLLRIHALCR